MSAKTMTAAFEKTVAALLPLAPEERRRVIEAGLLAADQMDAIDTESEHLVDQSVRAAKAGPMPAAADLLTDAYVSY